MEYTDFLGSIEPITLGLDRSTFSLDRKAYWGASRDTRRCVLSSDYEISRRSDDYFDVAASFTVSLEWSEENGSDVQALRIDCTYSGHFHAEAPISREHAERFTQNDSWIIFWPFFRQFVSDTTSKMGIPPLVVPLALGPGRQAITQKPRKALAEKAATKPATKRKKKPKEP